MLECVEFRMLEGGIGFQGYGRPVHPVDQVGYGGLYASHVPVGIVQIIEPFALPLHAKEWRCKINEGTAYILGDPA